MKEKKEGLQINYRISEKANQKIEEYQLKLKVKGVKKSKMECMNEMLENHK